MRLKLPWVPHGHPGEVPDHEPTDAGLYRKAIPANCLRVLPAVIAQATPAICPAASRSWTCHQFTDAGVDIIGVSGVDRSNLHLTKKSGAACVSNDTRARSSRWWRALKLLIDGGCPLSNCRLRHCLLGDAPTC